MFFDSQRPQNPQVAFVLADELHGSALFPLLKPFDDARVIEMDGAAEHVHEEGARDGLFTAAAKAFDTDLERVETELDIFVEQRSIRRRARGWVHLQKGLERQRLELLDSATAQIFLRQIVRENEARDLGPDAVDLPADPPLPAEQRDSLDVARHLSPPRKGTQIIARTGCDGQ